MLRCVLVLIRAMPTRWYVALLFSQRSRQDVRVLVFAKGEKEKEARDAGADYVGAEDLVAKIQEGWFDFDTAIATPDMMGVVGKIGKFSVPVV